MKINQAKGWALAAASLAAAVLLAGCSDFWQPAGGGGGGGGTTLTSNDFYILNGTASASIAGYSIVKGTLTALSGSPYTVTGTPYSMAIDPTGSFAYVSSTGGVILYTIDSTTGAMTQGSEVFQDGQALAIGIDPSGKWLLDASGQGTLFAIPITSTGTVDTARSVQQTAALAGTAVQQIAFEPSGGWVFVALGSAGTEAFPFAATNAAPITTTAAKIKPSNTSAGSALSVAVDPSNRLLYVGEAAAFPSSSSNSGGLRAFTIGATTLAELSGSPWASGGTGPHAILPESKGSHVYVANWAGTSAGNITGFSVSATSLTLLSNSVATGNEPVGLDQDLSGNFVLAVNATGSTTFDAYYFDTTTAGKLDLGLSSTSTGTSPVTVVAEP